MRIILGLIALFFGLGYPLIIYLGIQHFTPAILSIVLLALSVAKYVLAKDRYDFTQIGLFLFGLGYSILLIASNSTLLLKLYPFVLSSLLAITFAISLSAECNIIERISKAAGKTITQNAKIYTWRLTLIWSILLGINASIALYLALMASLAHWARYCGLLSYLAFGLVFIAEYAYRCYFIRRYGK